MTAKKCDYSSNIAFVYMDGWAEMFNYEKENNNMLFYSKHSYWCCLSETIILITSLLSSQTLNYLFKDQLSIL